MYYIQSQRRLLQSSYIKEDSQLLIKKTKFERNIKPNISDYSYRQQIGQYTFCTTSSTGASNFYVYQGNVCLAFLECHPYQITAGAQGQYAVDCLIADFIWIDSTSVTSTQILYDLLMHGSLSSKKFVALLSNQRVTSSTFNAYSDLLNQYFGTCRSYIYDNSIDAVIRLPQANFWYSLSSPRATVSRDIQLLICRPGYKKKLDTDTIQAYLKLRMKIRFQNRKKQQSRSGPPQKPLFMAIQNNQLKPQDWDVLGPAHSIPLPVQNTKVLAAITQYKNFDLNAALNEFKRRQYKVAPVTQAIVQQLQPTVGTIQIVPNTKPLRFAKALMVNGRAYSLLFLLIPTGPTTCNIIRVLIDK